jgi:hypothetical protein
MGSYSGSSDWDDLPAPQSFAAFKPAAAEPAAPPAPAPVADADADESLAVARGATKKRLNAIFAFDTTGSMTPWIENVQQKLDYHAAGLLKLMDMEIAFIGVGDHGDGRNMLQISPLSRDVDALKRAAAALQPTDGQDTPEAFECLFRVLNAARYDVPTVLVLITDSIPHGMEGWDGDDDGCPFGVDWRDELDVLRDQLRKVYVVSCATDPRIVALQRRMVGDNALIKVENFWRLTNLMMAICMEEVGELELFMGILEQQRGKERKAEVLRLLGRTS